MKLFYVALAGTLLRTFCCIHHTHAYMIFFCPVSFLQKTLDNLSTHKNYNMKSNFVYLEENIVNFNYRKKQFLLCSVSKIKNKQAAWLGWSNKEKAWESLG